MKKLIIQITAGRGPVECARVVKKVFDKLYKDFPNIEIIDYEEHNTESNCFMSISCSGEFLKGEIEYLKEYWEGTIQWIATKNSYRPNHKRKNWFVGINLIDPIELPNINESEIIYETCRSSGKGGQNVNKVETAVRAIYKDISVKCSDERSQFQNKERAKERLLLKLYELKQNKINNKNKETWINHISLERGNPKQIFKGEL